MPRPKLIKILKSKILLSDEEIIPLSDTEAWDKFYAAEAIMRAEREAKRKPVVSFPRFVCFCRLFKKYNFISHQI